MTEKDRCDALMNIQAALGIARGYVGAAARLSGTLSAADMDAMLERAGRDASALLIEAATGADVPRPEGTQITAPEGETLLVFGRPEGDGTEKT